MKLTYAILIVMFCLVNFAARAQKTISGFVTDESKTAIRGASVYIKGTHSGTITDSLGFFTIKVPGLPVTLACTALAYLPMEYLVAEKTTSLPIQFHLKRNLSSMDEVVVVGYGTRSKASLAGAVAGVATVHSAAPRRLMFRESEVRIRGAKPLESIAKMPTTGLLTAAEVSDFKKWKLWADYSINEFALHSREWSMSYTQRYSVIIQNADHTAIPGEKVYLLNTSTGDTTWAAVTDNTGKAELWGTGNQDYRIVSRTQKINNPALFASGLNRLRVSQPCGVSNKVNIAFVVDATGSMGDEIRYLQQELKSVINGTSAKYQDVNLSIASVFYRDRGDEYMTRHVGFQQDVSVVSEFMNRQSAGGGGDTPEAVEDALTTALDSLNWDAAAYSKIIFLVLDAPPHNQAAEKMNSLIRRSAKLGIRIVPVVCSGIDKSTEYLMRCVALATNGTYITLTDDSGIGNAHIKPTTDEFKVELLKDLLQRVIGEMIYVPACNAPVTNQFDKDTTKRAFTISVYPNPTRGPVTVTCSEAFEKVFVADFAGKILFKVPVQGKDRNLKVDLGNYPSGTYLLKYYMKNKGRGTEKIILVH